MEAATGGDGERWTAAYKKALLESVRRYRALGAPAAFMVSGRQR